MSRWSSYLWVMASYQEMHQFSCRNGQKDGIWHQNEASASIGDEWCCSSQCKTWVASGSSPIVQERWPPWLNGSAESVQQTSKLRRIQTVHPFGFSPCATLFMNFQNQVHFIHVTIHNIQHMKHIKTPCNPGTVQVPIHTFCYFPPIQSES